ncbi:hypothetical protein [Acidovorax sp. sic0104]|uniref:hypothetical protein n=1 Tax=Acidovorax sp. sic0104 TaxID=2854784 RepID=UPI001C453071|nr:hypothetical protein [Acidovorax sp. sic0104]MBV7541934.1 hypothetical protein [Acidovorax sp. sic0104]
MSLAANEERVGSVLALLERYEGTPLTRIDGFSLLKARTSGTRKRGIFVIEGNLNRDGFKTCHEEARVAGLELDKLYIYGHLGLYSGRMIEFTKFEDLGL